MQQHNIEKEPFFVYVLSHISETIWGTVSKLWLKLEQTFTIERIWDLLL
jgi:hypothetical protein